MDVCDKIPCEWTFATKFASDCECDGVVHSGLEGWGLGLADLPRTENHLDGLALRAARLQNEIAPDFLGGKLFYSQLELFCLQLSFFAYSPLRPLLDALSHCKEKGSNCKQKS